MELYLFNPIYARLFWAFNYFLPYGFFGMIHIQVKILHFYTITRSYFLSSFFIMGKGTNILGQVLHIIARVTVCHHVIDRKIDNLFCLKICTYSISLEREIFCEFSFSNHIFLSRDLSYFYCQLCQQ